MHVGLIVPVFSDNESWRIPALAGLATALTPHVELTVFPLRNPAGPERMNLYGATVIDRGAPGLRLRTLARRLLAALRAEHERRPFDLLHGYWLFEPGLLAIAAGRMIGVPVVTSIGGAEPACLPGIGYGGQIERRGRLTFRAVSRASTLITGGSNYVLELARDAGAPADRLRLAPLPVSCPDGRPEARDCPSGPLLLQVGAYLPVKGQDIAIRALPAIRATHSGVRLAMIGENPRKYRERMVGLARDLGVCDAVEFHDRVPHAALGEWYEAASLLLMPSRHESQGMVVLEAARHGLPALGSAVGVVRDLAPDGAVAVKPGDVAALAGAATALLSDEARRADLGRAARAAVGARYGVEPVGDTWLAIYREALERGRR